MQLATRQIVQLNTVHIPDEDLQLLVTPWADPPTTATHHHGVVIFMTGDLQADTRALRERGHSDVLLAIYEAASVIYGAVAISVDTRADITPGLPMYE